MLKLKIKTGDEVAVVAGRSKGRIGRITRVLKKTNRVIVQGVNMVRKHTRASAASAGGIIEKEASIHVSNVALLDPVDRKPTRVGVKILDNGDKVRYAKRSGEIIDK